MSTFAVIREAGPTWADERGLRHQPAVGPHSAFMNGLAEGGLSIEPWRIFVGAERLTPSVAA